MRYTNNIKRVRFLYIEYYRIHYIIFLGAGKNEMFLLKRGSKMNIEKFKEQKRFKNKKIVLMLIKYIIFVSRRSIIQPYT